MDYLVSTLLVAAWCIGAPALFLCFVAGEEPGEPGADHSR
jgi:hypothetical protein